MKKLSWLTLIIGVTAILVIAILGLVLISPARAVFASALGGDSPMSISSWAAAWHAGRWGNGSGVKLPPVLQGLTSIPSDQRFAHFTGAQINLKDENNQALTIRVIPGKVTTASATRLSIAANDGSEQSFTINDQTMIHSKTTSNATPTSTPVSPSTISNGDEVIVVTLNNSDIATAIIDGGPSGFVLPGSGGW